MAVRLQVNRAGRALTSAEISKNFEDLHPPLSRQEAMVESSRCLFCYDAPCIQACPTSIDIPKFIRQVATNNLTGSAKTILSSNIMGGTCARACPTEILCEEKCVLNAGENEPIKIGALQRIAVDHLIDEGGEHPFSRADNTGKSVAVVGAGPAGMSCAHALAMNGHSVTVFEAREKPGGLNEYGLAAYKMVDEFAAREVKFILDVGGIEIRYNEALGLDLDLEALMREYDAVFLGVGLTVARDMGLGADKLSGVQDAIEFIETLRQASDFDSLEVGDNVVVIGGGNTAVDAAVQAKRLGATSVSLVYRRGSTQMGATDFEQDLAGINGVNVVHWSKPISLNGDSAVSSVSFEVTHLKEGRLVGTGEVFDLEADQVLVAVGQYMSEAGLDGLELDGGKIKIDDSFATSLAGVFAGGDCVRSGDDLTVQSVQDGKEAAAAMHNYLGGV